MTDERLDSLPPLPTIEPPARPAPPDTGLEQIGTNSVRLPRLKLRQELTRNADGVPEGSIFISSQPGDHALGRTVVLLAVRKERALRLPVREDDAKNLRQRIIAQTGVEVPADWQGTVCFSRDRILPEVQPGIDPLNPNCLNCPMGRWRTVNGRRVNDCAESFRLILFDRRAQVPCIFFANGSAVRPARDLLTALKVACRRHERPAFGFTVELSTRRVEADDGHFFVPVFDRPEPIADTAEVSLLADLSRSCGDRYGSGED
jgi:hypothetical protein